MCFKGYFELGGAFMFNETEVIFWFSGWAPVRTGTLLVVPGGPAAQGENSPVMTGQRDTHEGERDMMDSHTGGRRERR